MSHDDEDPSLLVVVLDASTPFWLRREIARNRQDKGERPPTLQETVEGLLIFLESYLMMHRQNELCVVACSDLGSRVLFPTAMMEAQGRSLSTGSVGTRELHSSIQDGLLAMTREEAQKVASVREGDANGAGGAEPSGGGGGGGGGLALAAALSRGLCYINRKLQEESRLQARLLVLQGSRDAPERYNSVMNAIFSAQKASVLVDCYTLSEQHSIFLQQAAYLTGGVYLRCAEKGLAQYLLTTFLPSQSCRKYLKLAKQQTVDFRAACFCHRKVVEIAYVCSVCLSVFCEFSPECAMCGTRAWPKKLKTGGGGKQAVAARGGGKTRSTGNGSG